MIQLKIHRVMAVPLGVIFLCTYCVTVCHQGLTVVCSRPPGFPSPSIITVVYIEVTWMSYSGKCLSMTWSDMSCCCSGRQSSVFYRVRCIWHSRTRH